MSTHCRCEACTPIARRTYTEKHRHECEVRMLAAMKSHGHRDDYINGSPVDRGVRQIRGDAAADALIASLRASGHWAPRASAPDDPFGDLFS